MFILGERGGETCKQSTAKGFAQRAAEDNTYELSWKLKAMTTKKGSLCFSPTPEFRITPALSVVSPL